jgi:hypothetical protein
MTTSASTKADDHDDPQEEDSGHHQQEKDDAEDDDGVRRQEENGNVQHDNSKDFVVRDGFPALRLPTGQMIDISMTSTTNSADNNTSKKKNVWWIDGDEPIPQRSFWANETCFNFDTKQLPTMLRDARHVFSTRTRENGQAYSAGTTYFVPCIMKPRCALEAMALEIFQRHTQHLPDGVVVPEQSGAEWWTLVLNDDDNDQDDDDDDADNTISDNDSNSNAKMKTRDAPTAAASSTRKKKSIKNTDNNSTVDEEESVDDDDDEVGLHYDADYGLEDQVPHLLLHPRLATVTYLTSTGAPTVVLDCPSPHSQRQRERSEHDKAVARAKSNENEDDVMLSWHGTSVRKAWISHPRVGKHIAFDGRLLHGAPATFFPPADSCLNEKKKRKVPTSASDENEEDPPAAKRAKHSMNEQNDEAKAVNQRENLRVTFLVNIWINHCPLDAEPLDDEICEQLKTPWDWWSPAAAKDKKAQSGGDPTTEQDGEANIVAAAETTKTPVFAWNDDVRVDEPPVMESTQLQKWSSVKDVKDDVRQFLEPAGEEEVVICSRLVTVKYESTLEDLRQATAMAGIVEMEFEEGALIIQVGEKVESEDEDDEDD